MDIIQRVLDDHTTFRDDFQLLQDLEGVAAPSQLAAAWDRLSKRLETHALGEEDLLYPALLKHARQQAAGETVEALRNHNEIRASAQRVADHEPGSAGWWGAIELCRVINEEHLLEEENEVLPDARDSIAIGQLKYMGEQWKTYMHEHAEPGPAKHVDPEKFVAENKGL